MFSAHQHRVTVVLLLTAYSLATTLGGSLHNHDEHASGNAALGCRQLAGGQPVVSGGHSHNCTLHDDDCSVCRFAGQRVVSPGLPPAVPLCQLSVELSIAHPIFCACPIARTTHSRAPPLIG